MVFCRRVTAITASNLCQWIKGIRVKFIFLCIGLLIVYELLPVLSYGMDYDRTVPLFILPMFFGSNKISLASPKMMMYIGLLCMLCDAPFHYPLKPYVIQRSGKTAQCLGDCLYIMIVSLCYLVFITVVSTVMILPIASLQDTYSGVLTDMALGTGPIGVYQMAIDYPHMQLPTRVIQMLYPSGAQIYTFFVGWLSFVFLGMLMYWVSLLSGSSMVGIAAAGFFVFLDPILVWAAWPNRYWLMVFSPVCWSSAEQLNLLGADRFISIPMVLVEGGILLILLTITSMGLIKRKDVTIA